MKLTDIQKELDTLCAQEPFKLVAKESEPIGKWPYVDILLADTEDRVVTVTRQHNDQGVLWTWMEGFEDALSLLTKLRLRK